MAILSAELSSLLSQPTRLPLDRARLKPIQMPDTLRLNATELFTGARNPHAALAGLLLRLGHWEESHNVAQDIQSADGSYWHAIIHRMEPDSFNSGYWFRRTGQHPIFALLYQRTTQILGRDRPTQWKLKSAWDPFLFIEWCDEARAKGGVAEAAAADIQMAEWELLFEWCSGLGL
jgi:hypothetical protein